MASFSSVDRKAHVTFRTQLLTCPRSVHVVGSWDRYRRAHPLEQDARVGRDIWKGSVPLEMGSEYTYYFLLDGSRALPEQVMFVPVEVPEDLQLPPTPKAEESRISSPDVMESSVLFEGFDSEAAFEQPREVPTPTPPPRQKPSIREKLWIKTTPRKKSADPHQHKRKWSLSTAGRLKPKNSEMTINPNPPTDDDLRSVAGYLRDSSPATNTTPTQLFYSPLSPVRPPSAAPSLCHSTASSAIDWLAESELETPAEAQAPPEESANMMRYYNFDEVKGGKEVGDGMKPLGCLRDQVDDEMRWRREWGYLGGVVV